MSNPVGSFRPSLDDTYTPHTHTARPTATPTTEHSPAQLHTMPHTSRHVHVHCTYGPYRLQTYEYTHYQASTCTQVSTSQGSWSTPRKSQIHTGPSVSRAHRKREAETKERMGVMLRGTMACRAPGATAIHRSLRARRHEPLSPHASMECFHAARCVYPAITATSVPPHCRACPPAHLVSAVSSLLVGA